MGKRGPKPQPAGKKAREGNAGKRPINENEPKPAAAAAPDPPPWLGPVAVAKWLDVAPKLLALGLLSELDLDALAIYCAAWQDLADADATIAKEGAYFTTEKGYTGVHPAATARRYALDRIRKVGADFGMSPASRPGVEGDGAQAGGELEKFLAAG